MTTDWESWLKSPNREAFDAGNSIIQHNDYYVEYYKRGFWAFCVLSSFARFVTFIDPFGF